jgi:(1->4)-alpha-D-glucan 1-alpha-D-glucosylmutase
LHGGFRFEQAAEVVDYYDRLGVSHYVSPILAARPGSTHGYDVVDPTRINPELGGEAGLRTVPAPAST